jgi:hypothetical protein
MYNGAFMGYDENQDIEGPVETRDRIERKLRGATSLLVILSGENRETFLEMSSDLQDGFIDTLVDLAEDARQTNRRTPS